VNPAELKKLLKPLVKELVKESVQEVLIKEGLLATVVSEVAKGMNGTVITEAKKQAPVARGPSEEQKLQELKRQKKELLDAIGKDSFRGVDIFEGVDPYSIPPEPAATTQGSPLSGMAPNDSGVDISSIVALGGNAWKQLLK
jgi:hypothetical protein